MDDGSINSDTNSLVRSLVKEWSLFWASITEDNEDDNDLELPEEKLQSLSLAQIQNMMKALSEDRKALNQEMEVVHEQLEIENDKFENLKLSNANTTSCLARIDELHDIGQALSEAMQKIDNRISEARKRGEDLDCKEISI